MLTDVKAWLKTTGYPVEAVLFLKPPAPPYIVFSDKTDVSGADSKNCIADRAITIELYADSVDTAAEAAIESLLNAKAIPYSKELMWIQTERFFQTVYDINLVEKF